MLATLLQNLINALQWGSFYALIALGYTLVYGVLTLINFAHGDVFMVGAYIAFFVATFLLGTLGFARLGRSGPDHPADDDPDFAGRRHPGAGRLPAPAAQGGEPLYVVITALMCGLILEHANLALFGASRKAFPTLIEDRSTPSAERPSPISSSVSFSSPSWFFCLPAVDRHQDPGRHGDAGDFL